MAAGELFAISIVIGICVVICVLAVASAKTSDKHIYYHLRIDNTELMDEILDWLKNYTNTRN